MQNSYIPCHGRWPTNRPTQWRQMLFSQQFWNELVHILAARDRPADAFLIDEEDCRGYLNSESTRQGRSCAEFRLIQYLHPRQIVFVEVLGQLVDLGAVREAEHLQSLCVI